MTRHRLSVMRNENPTRLRGDADYRGVGQADHTAVKAFRKSTDGSLRRRPTTIFWLKSASARNRGGLMLLGHE